MWHQDRPAAPVVKTLALIMVELMQKVPNTNGVIGVRNLERWPLQSSASKFLLRLESTGSLPKLTDVSLLFPEFPKVNLNQSLCEDAFVDPKTWGRWDLIPLIRKALATTLPPSRLGPEEEWDSDP
jgi:hypothetical protein